MICYFLQYYHQHIGGSQANAYWQYSKQAPVRELLVPVPANCADVRRVAGTKPTDWGEKGEVATTRVATFFVALLTGHDYCN